MENQNNKRGRGRPPKYSTGEERKDACFKTTKIEVHARQRMVL